jgi:hypothetical protein
MHPVVTVTGRVRGGVGGYPAPATPALACGPKSDKLAQHGAIRVRSSQSER